VVAGLSAFAEHELQARASGVLTAVIQILQPAIFQLA